VRLQDLMVFSFARLFSIQVLSAILDESELHGVFWAKGF
jgi:hypothetical protein